MMETNTTQLKLNRLIKPINHIYADCNLT